MSDSIDTSDETTKISVTVKSLVNELYLDDLRNTTERGLDDRFSEGFSTGGRTYGYRSEAVKDDARMDPRGNPLAAGYRLSIVPEEADRISEIFRLFRDGVGEKTIAKRLNASGTGRICRPNTIYLMLQNPKYSGPFLFNRREWRKNPQTGRRVYRWRDEDQCECVTTPGLAHRR